MSLTQFKKQTFAALGLCVVLTAVRPGSSEGPRGAEVLRHPEAGLFPTLRDTDAVRPPVRTAGSIADRSAGSNGLAGL